MARFLSYITPYIINLVLILQFVLFILGIILVVKMIQALNKYINNK